MGIWKPVKNYEGLYEVSDQGEVRSVNRVVTSKDGKQMNFKGKVKSQELSKNGYLRVRLSKEGKVKNRFVHRLVAEAFIGNIPDEYEVNHIDCNPLNNELSNLEIVSHLDNIRHSYNQGHYYGINHKKVRVVYKNGDVTIFNSHKETAESLGISIGGFNKIINKTRSGNKIFSKLGIDKIEKC